jgi:hypothetical protein
MAKHEIMLESFQGSVERHYFSVLELLRSFGFKVLKTRDTFDSSVTSAYWGSIEQRRTMQQEKASQFLAGTSNMIKQMFQIVRTLRIMDERYAYYKDAKAGDKSAEIALKGLWIDMVEGAGKNPSSVYGLAATVGFATLPDLFFEVCPKDVKDLDKKMKELRKQGFNRKVIDDALRRKLYQYMQWRDKTAIEMVSSRKFHLAYLRQHFNTIRLYLNWIKPYLRNVNRLKQKSSRDADMLQMADTAVSDIELYAYKPGGKKYIPTITISFEFRTVPELAFRQEYQQGPLHIGRTTIKFESKEMLIEEIREKWRDEMLKDIEIVKSLDSAMAVMGEELVKYLDEAKEADPAGKLGIKLEKGEEKPPKQEFNVLGPFKDVGKGFKEIFGAFIPKKKEDAKKEIKSLITYDLPPEIKELWEGREKLVKGLRPKEKKGYKFREECEDDKEYKEFLSKLKKLNTFEEGKEKKAALETAEGKSWKIYDTFKKGVGAVRW